MELTLTFHYTSLLPKATDNKQRKEDCNWTTLGEIININEEGFCLFFHSKSRRGWPSKGIASEVCGKASAIMREKTERDSRIVTPGTKKGWWNTESFLLLFVLPRVC